MTPEQENELVARWMGWTTQKYGTLVSWWPPAIEDLSAAPLEATHRIIHHVNPPPYRTDPALLWELEDRLSMQYGWHFSYDEGTNLWYAHCRREASPHTCASRAEAVFAAAVMQATQDKETRDDR